jgi:hypothetical protein
LLGSALALSLAVLAAGCTSDKPTPPGPLPPVRHAKAQLPPDRNEEAVTAALGQLDACSLLDPAAAKDPDFPVRLRPEPRGPHRCELISDKTYHDLDVTIGTPLTAPARFGQLPLTIAGQKAYLNQSGGQCRLAVPVSFTRAIELRAELNGPRSKQCRQVVTRFGSALVNKLAHPAAIRTQVPLAQWNTCDMLRAAHF